MSKETHTWEFVRPVNGTGLQYCSECGMQRKYRNKYSREDGYFYRRRSMELWSWSPDNQAPPHPIKERQCHDES